MKGLAMATAVAALLLSACAHEQRRAEADAREAPYVIGHEDVLDVAVWRDADLSRTVPVRPDGFISLPLVGDIEAAGKTPSELAKLIGEKLKPWVQEPNVAVIVKEVNSVRVYVTGEVIHPGAYPLRGRMSVLQAIALAGGFSDFANRDRIVVIRTSKNGEQFPVRYDDLVSGSDDKDTTRDFPLHPGDTVVVP